MDFDSESWKPFLRKRNRIERIDRGLWKDADTRVTGALAGFPREFQPYDSLWKQIFGDHTVAEAITLLQRIQRLKRRPIVYLKRYVVLADTSWVCVIGRRGVIWSTVWGQTVFVRARKPRKKNPSINRHHMLPASRGGAAVASNLVYMRIARHCAWHKKFGLATWSEVIDGLSRWRVQHEPRIRIMAA